MQWSSRQHKIFSTYCSILSSLAVIILWSSCGGTPERTVTFEPQPEHVIEETPTPPITIIEEPAPTQTPIPAPIQSDHEFGLIVRHQSTLDTNDWTGLASKYNATHIQIGGEVVRAVEDLIFNAELQNKVRRLSRQAKQDNLKVFVWSRELNLGDGLFRFDQTDPFYAARQAAYRNVLNLLPEIDGFVLQFSDAQSPPWSAVADPTVAPPPPIEGVRFVVDMVKQVVVDDMRKSLWVRIGDEGPQPIEWISSALRQLNSPQIGVILTQQTWLDANYNQRAWFSQQFEGQRVILEADATMESRGGLNAIISIVSPLNHIDRLIGSFDFQGYAASIDTQNGLIFDTPNRSNLSLLQSEDHSKNPLASLQQWIEQEYKFSPITREGILFKNLFLNSWECAKKTYQVSGSDDFSFQWDIKNPPLFNNQELNTPTQQTLTDIAQSSYEAKYLLEKQLAQIQEIQFNLPFTQISSIEQGIKNQIEMANLLYYAKQCFWGYQLWKTTRNEQEALYLEGHLQALQKLTGTMTQTYSLNHEQVDTGSLLSFISNIRMNFPRVLFGASERSWNKILDVEIRQTGSQSIEVIWTTEKPSTGGCKVTSVFPNIWEKSGETSFFPDTRHQVVIDDLEAGKNYEILVYSSSDNGLIINSKDHSFSLDEETIF